MTYQSEIIDERSRIAQKIADHLETWQEFKTKQSRKNSDFRSGGLFNLLDLLDDTVVRQAIDLYMTIKKTE